MKLLAAAGTVLTATVLIAGAMTPGYDQARDTVSLLGAPGQPMSLVARAGMMAYGALVLAAARSAGAQLIAVYGASAIVAGVVPKDPTAGAAMLNAIHVDATLVGGAALLVAMVTVAMSAELASDRRASFASAGVALLGVVAFRLCWGSPTYGLLEKALIALATCWLFLWAPTALGLKAQDRATASTPSAR